MFQGKWIHDGEGGVIKNTGIHLMSKPETIWDQNKTYSGNLCTMFGKHFGNDRYKLERCFYEIPADEISTQSSQNIDWNYILFFISHVEEGPNVL